MGEVQLGKTWEKTENKKTSWIEKVALNKQGAQNLRAASAKNPPQQKKEKKFSMSLGTTEVSSEDRTMRVSTTGLKFKNQEGTTELTVWASTVHEQERPWEQETSKNMLGFSLSKKF